MKKNFSDNLENTYHYYFIKCYMQAIEMTCSCPDVEKFNKDCCEFLPMVLEKAFSIISSSNVCKVTFYFIVHNSIFVCLFLHHYSVLLMYHKNHLSYTEFLRNFNFLNDKLSIVHFLLILLQYHKNE